MASKVRVYAKSQKWAALGIVDAYLKMYPQATLEDLNKAFPRNVIVPSKKTDAVLFGTWKQAEEAAAKTEATHDDEMLETRKKTNYFVTLNNGTEITVMPDVMWAKDAFAKMLEYAKVYDIEIAEYEAADKGFGKRGEYRLEYLNGYIPPVPKKSKAWLWILIAAIVVILGLLAWLLFGKKPAPEVQVVEVEKTVIVHDTLYIQQIEEIEQNFNAAEFEQGKAELPEGAKFVLHDLAKIMQKNPQLRLRLEGHTSAEGDATFNQKLSEARAQAAVDFLVEHEGVDVARLEAVGLGSSQLKNAEDPMAAENRRTEFIVIE